MSKSGEDAIASSKVEEVQIPGRRVLNRSLGLFDSTMIVAGSMIGSGIFIVAGEMAREVGSTGWLLLAWVIAGVLTLAAALSYGELAAMMPRAGGQYVYLREAYSPLWGFLVRLDFVSGNSDRNHRGFVRRIFPISGRSVAADRGEQLHHPADPHSAQLCAFAFDRATGCSSWLFRFLPGRT